MTNRFDEREERGLLPSLTNSRLYGLQMREAGKKYASFDPTLQSMLFASECMRAEFGGKDRQGATATQKTARMQKTKKERGRSAANRKIAEEGGKKQKRHPYLDSAAIAYRNSSAPPSLAGRLPSVRGKQSRGRDSRDEEEVDFYRERPSYVFEPRVVGDNDRESASTVETVEKLRQKEKELERELRILLRGATRDLPGSVKIMEENQAKALQKYGEAGQEQGAASGQFGDERRRPKRSDGGERVAAIEIHSGGLELWEGHAIVYEEAEAAEEEARDAAEHRMAPPAAPASTSDSAPVEEEMEGRGERADTAGKWEQSQEKWERAQLLEHTRERAEKETADMLRSLSHAERTADEALKKLNEEAEVAKAREREVILGKEEETTEVLTEGGKGEAKAEAVETAAQPRQKEEGAAEEADKAAERKGQSPETAEEEKGEVEQKTAADEGESPAAEVTSGVEA